MKLTVIGGAGVRSPLLTASALRWAGRIGLDELCLMDINPEKLALLGALCRHIGRREGSPVRITTTTGADEALDGAGYIITTIRVGEEQGRVHDERIALKHGVLGQETTGPGGFAMAMRSIPAILGYAALAEKRATGAWIFNFTNPAGLVTQALRDRGFARTVGICDSANGAQHEAARFLDVPPDSLQAEVFGLNHLSWTKRILRDGRDILPDLLADDAFLAATNLRMFDPELVRHLGMFLNEYLFYFYYAEKALASIQAEELTRGEEVLQLNRRLLDRLRAIDVERHPEEGLRAYLAYEHRRSATYMHYANPGGPSMEEADQAAESPVELSMEGGEGYAGVALKIIQALETGEPARTALNVPNAGALDFMQPQDVIEVSCVIENGGIRTIPVEGVPEHQQLLMRSVKLYERRAVEATLNRSRQQAIYALMAHPLVLSYSLARTLVDEYLVAHAATIGEWT